MAFYENKTSCVSAELQNLDYSTIYPEPLDQIEDTKTIEKTQKAALLIQAAWKERKQKKSTFKVVLNPQIKIGKLYAGEIPSLEFGLKDEKGNQLAIYQNGYQTLKETEKEWLKDPNISSEKKIESLRAKKLTLTTYFSDKQLQARQFTSLKSKTLNQYGENCVVIKDGNIYIYPKIRADSYRGKTKASRNHSSASRGNPVVFSGTIKKGSNNRWTLSNLSGHYGTEASKLAFCLKAFQKAGIPLEDIDVQHNILVDASYARKFSNPSFSVKDGYKNDKKFLVKTTNAIEWMKQTSNLSCKKKTQPEKILYEGIYNKKNSCCTIS